LLASVDLLTAAGATTVQINVVDEAVAPADGLRIVHQAPAPDAFVSLWLPTAHLTTREPVDLAIRAAAGNGAQLAAYLVTESCPLTATDPDPGHIVPPGTRTPGFAQMALLRRPAGQTRDDFLAAWLDRHTQVAIETQSTFSYTQHVTVRPLTVAGATAPDAALDPIDGIVEECFPTAAMTDPHVFFAAVGDDERLRDHTSRMVASTSAFLDYDRIDVIPTSRYRFG
jgi:hypothetical protein